MMQTSDRNTTAGGEPERTPSPPGSDETLDAIFDPSRMRLNTVMKRQSDLVSLAWHFAVASVAVPVGGIVLGLLAVLFAREAYDMMDLVGGTNADRQRARKSLVIGGTATALWLIITIVGIFILASWGS